MPDLDPAALLRGAAIAVVLAVPIAIIGVAFDFDDDSNWVFAFFALILVAFGLGGYVAARYHAASPLTHGAIAALLGYGLVQAVAIIRRLIDSEDVRWLGVVFNGLLAASAGLLGAVLAVRRLRTR